MNKKLGLAVAGALGAFSSAANAGITIPAGDWTVDIGGNVNAYYTHTTFSGDVESNTKGVLTNESSNQVSTGLLPSALGIGGKTRQNDLDIAFQFTFFTGINASGQGSGGSDSNGAQGNSLNIRQAYMTFGDASWGQIKAGRDLGVFGSDAILSDMTLLGVGNGAGGAGNSTLGRIGSGYLYADWVGQLQYSTPNWNGFQVTAAVREPWGNSTNNNLGFDAKATYDFAADSVTGRVWVGGISQKTSTGSAGSYDEKTARAVELGAKASIGDLGLVAYGYDGQNMGIASYSHIDSSQTGGVTNYAGLTLGGNSSSKDQDVKGGYVQATYKIPTGTKLGASYGISKIDATSASGKQFEHKSWIIGAYHPLTKSLNLVAEYTNSDVENNGNVANVDGKAKTVALGAILFF